MDRADVIRKLSERLGDEPGLACAYLFGSFARGEPTGRSDVDVAVLYEEALPRKIGDVVDLLHAELEERLDKAVDLVVLDSAPVDLVHRVLRDGVLMAERNPARRIDFEVAARSAFFDLQPYLKAYRQGGRA